MATITELGLTELEQSFINSLIDALYAEPGFSDVEVKEIAEYMNVPVNTAKGVLGSLTKKGFVTTDYADVNGKKYEFLILHYKYWYLHPEWAKHSHPVS